MLANKLCRWGGCWVDGWVVVRASKCHDDGVPLDVV